MFAQNKDSIQVSVCIPTYKHKKWLTRCVNSIIEQKTYFKFEILIGIEFDDLQSIDYIPDNINSKKIELKYIISQKKNLIYINHRRTGRGNFYNLLKNVKGKYISVCDGDDYWADPFKIQKQFEILESDSNLSLIYCNADVISDSKGDYINNLMFYGKNYGIPTVKSQKYFLKHNFAILLATTMFRSKDINKNTLKKIEKFSTGDLPLYFILSGKGDFYYLNEPMVVYNDHGGGISKTFGKLKRDLINYKHIFNLLPYIKKQNHKLFNYFCHTYLITPIFKAIFRVIQNKEKGHVSFSEIYFLSIKHLNIKYLYYILKLTLLKIINKND